ncbi:hypothetical protein [Nocardioides convexus]|nr:hypothetical protein [Nocardioides convexus]
MLRQQLHAGMSEQQILAGWQDFVGRIITTGNESPEPPHADA